MNRGAGAYIVDGEGRVLVVHQNYGRHRWSVPGGAVEPGETPEQACAREVLEETGAEVDVGPLLANFDLATGANVSIFRCTIIQGSPCLQPGDELAAVEWLHPAEIPDPRSNALRLTLEAVA